MSIPVVVATTTALTVLGFAHPRRRARAVLSPAAHRTRPLARRSRLLALDRRRRDAQLDHAMPDLLDLLVLTLQAGVPAPAAFVALVSHVPPPVAPAVIAVVERCGQGDRFVDALDALIEHLGTRALGLVAAIGAAERSGLPLAPTIDHIADDARAHRRRSAEIEARRLPVRLAVPLVCCTLPSFVCIALGPVLVGALSALRSA